MKKNVRIIEWLKSKENKIQLLLEQVEELKKIKNDTHTEGKEYFDSNFKHLQKSDGKIQVSKIKLELLQELQKKSSDAGKEYIEIKYEYDYYKIHPTIYDIIQMNENNSDCDTLEDIFSVVEENGWNIVFEALSYIAKRSDHQPKYKTRPAPKIKQDIKAIKKAIDIVEQYSYDNYNTNTPKLRLVGEDTVIYLNGLVKDLEDVIDLLGNKRYSIKKLKELNLRFLDIGSTAKLLSTRIEDQVQIELDGILNLLQYLNLKVEENVDVILKKILYYIHEK
ncbi:MAG: hypothetical protein Q8S36_09125 [Sulfuricurvum sp.]|nr:hypothetical protein [Sulfuricurvum sp.]